MSIRELAAEADITPKTLTDIEYGRRRPTYETMRTISKALGVSAHDIQEFVDAIEARGRRKSDDSGRHPANLQFEQPGDRRRSDLEIGDPQSRCDVSAGKEN